MKHPTDWEWPWKIISPINQWLMQHRLIKCNFCLGKDDYGCSCDACGVVYPGSYGWWWCSSFVGCHVCGRPEKNFKMWNKLMDEEKERRTHE